MLLVCPDACNMFDHWWLLDWDFIASNEAKTPQAGWMVLSIDANTGLDIPSRSSQTWRAASSFSSLAPMASFHNGTSSYADAVERELWAPCITAKCEKHGCTDVHLGPVMHGYSHTPFILFSFKDQDLQWLHLGYKLLSFIVLWSTFLSP
jgi:hypothetical protein